MSTQHARKDTKNACKIYQFPLCTCYTVQQVRTDRERAAGRILTGSTSHRDIASCCITSLSHDGIMTSGGNDRALLGVKKKSFEQLSKGVVVFSGRFTQRTGSLDVRQL